MCKWTFRFEMFFRSIWATHTYTPLGRTMSASFNNVVCLLTLSVEIWHIGYSKTSVMSYLIKPAKLSENWYLTDNIKCKINICNEFNFWFVHGIMNPLGLLLCKRPKKHIVMALSMRQSIPPFHGSVHIYCLSWTISLVPIGQIWFIFGTNDKYQGLSNYPISFAKIDPITLELLPLF